MTPKEYLDRYTYLQFDDPLTLQTQNAGITAYGSYWGSRQYPGQGNKKVSGEPIKKEYELFTNALRMAHHGNTHTKCGERFVFEERPLGMIFPTEEFYATTVFNAYLGKGSPDEIIDTMRLAMAVGRINLFGIPDAAGQPPAFPTAQEYADRFMTLDCNGLVRNYCGAAVNEIKYYAAKERRRLDPTKVEIGDVVVTHCNAVPYEHVGLIDGWDLDGGNVTVSVAEWGQPGDESVHYSTGRKVVARSFVNNGFTEQVGVGWVTTSNLQPVQTYRSIYSRPVWNDPHGWS